MLNRSLSSSHVRPVARVQISTRDRSIVWTCCAFLSHNDFVSPSSVPRLYMEQNLSGRTVFSFCSVNPPFFSLNVAFSIFFQLAFSLRRLTHRRASKPDVTSRVLPNLFSHLWLRCHSHNGASRWPGRSSRNPRSCFQTSP